MIWLLKGSEGKVPTSKIIKGELGDGLAGKNTTQVQSQNPYFYKAMCSNPNIPKTRFKMQTVESPRVSGASQPGMRHHQKWVTLLHQGKSLQKTIVPSGGKMLYLTCNISCPPYMWTLKGDTQEPDASWPSSSLSLRVSQAHLSWKGFFLSTYINWVKRLQAK